MAHYWNPTNYNNRNDLVVPPELANPKLFPDNHYKFDAMDEFFRSVRGSYPFELNAQTRWYEKPEQYEDEKYKFLDKMVNEEKYFYEQKGSGPDPNAYTENEQKMV